MNPCSTASGTTTSYYYPTGFVELQSYQLSDRVTLATPHAHSCGAFRHASSHRLGVALNRPPAPRPPVPALGLPLTRFPQHQGAKHPTP